MRSKVLAEAFGELWARNYPRAAPLSYLVRQLYPERWFRIHSLPESKRYPETEAELQLLLERQFTLIRDVFGDLADAVLVSGYYTVGAEPELEQFLQGDDLLRQLEFSALASVKVEDDSTYWPLVATPELTPSLMQALLRAAAEDRCRFFLIHKESGAIIAPYDGGMDSILPTSAARDLYHQKYQAWLSPHPSGL